MKPQYAGIDTLLTPTLQHKACSQLSWYFQKDIIEEPWNMLSAGIDNDSGNCV